MTGQRPEHQEHDIALLAPRVEVVEREMGQIRTQIGSLQTHVDRGFERVAALISQQQAMTASELKERDARFERAVAQISGKFDEQVRSRSTNWSVVIAAVSLGVVIVGSIGSAWVLPLARADQTHETALAQITIALEKVRDIESDQKAQLARLDERSKFALYRESPKQGTEKP